MKLKHALPLTLPLLVAMTMALPADAQILETQEPGEATRGTYDRNDIPGEYTVGFYSNEDGSSDPLKLTKDQEEFDVWIGLTGDSTRVFSGMAMAIVLPYGVELAGPVLWTPRSGLKAGGDLLVEGMTVEFHYECAQQKSRAPAILGRVPLKLRRGVNEAVLVPAPHPAFGLSVELCSDERIWPKPYAQPVSVSVMRKQSFWDRVTGWFN